MEARTQRARTASSSAAQSAQQTQTAPSGQAAELDYSPKKMTPRQSVAVTLKLLAAAAAFFGLLWLAHARLEN
jgi:hypothetical protein